MRYPRIVLNSDLHLDTGPFTLDSSDTWAIAVFAGDTTHGPGGMAALRALTQHPIVAVAGNHDYWGSDYYEALATLRSGAAAAGIHFLENRAVVLAGVRFLGATLWTDYAGGHPALLHYGLWHMNDHRHIRAARWWTTANKQRFLRVFGQHALEHFEGAFNPLLARELHLKTKQWLLRALARPFAGPTVIVTHHAPAVESLLRSGVVRMDSLTRADWHVRRSDDLNLTRLGSYASDILPDIHRELDAAGVVLWAHGHLHHALNYALGGVRIASNPRGRILPPLSREQAQAYRLMGYSISDAAIDESQRRYAANPELGDGVGYERNRLIDLEDSGYSCIMDSQAKTLAQLKVILAEARALRPLAQSKRLSVADLAGYRADTLKAKAINVTRDFAEDMARQLVRHPMPQPTLDSLLASCLLTRNRRLVSTENLAGYDWIVREREHAKENPEQVTAYRAAHSAVSHVRYRIQELEEMLACVARAEPASKALQHSTARRLTCHNKKTVAELSAW